MNKRQEMQFSYAMTHRVVEYERIIISPDTAPRLDGCPICGIFKIHKAGEHCRGVCPLYPCKSKARDRLDVFFFILPPEERQRLARNRLRQIFRRLKKAGWVYK